MLPLLRSSCPKLARRFFSTNSLCRSCQNLRAPRNRPHSTFQPSASLRSRPLAYRTIRWSKQQIYYTSNARLSSTTSLPGVATTSTGRSFFPEETDRIVAYWLLGSAASVFGLVVFGGLTRLTESGLSITEWRPVTGSLPPSNENEWQSEFSKYQASPEFKLLNPNMTMSEFKKIYYMEWTHRVWGRFVGISFVVPAFLFIASRKVSKTMSLRISGIGALIGFQGALGWWMVKSGLKDDLFAPGSHPRVSQYRLVAHLGTAFLCYSAMLWNGMQILRERRMLNNLADTELLLSKLRHPSLRPFRKMTGALACLVFITAMSGGFVAGLDAGLIYNDFPWMGESLAPPVEELFSKFYSKMDDSRDLWWRNAFENPSLAQLDHRILATTTFSAIVALFAYSRFGSSVKHVLPAGSRKAMHGVLGFACLQVVLGISTLIYLVPLPLASAHQAGSLALLSYVLVLGNRAWLPRRRFATALARRVAATRPEAVRKALLDRSTRTTSSSLLQAFPELQKLA